MFQQNQLSECVCMKQCILLVSTLVKDFRATQVRCLTAATAAVALAFLFVEMLCYVLGRLHSSCVLCTKIGLLR